MGRRAAPAPLARTEGLLLEVVTGLADLPEPALIDRLVPMVAMVEGCRVEGIRSPDGLWVRTPTEMSSDELEAAVSARGTGPGPLHLEGRAWARALVLWTDDGSPLRPTLLVVSSHVALEPTSVHLLETFADAFQQAHARHASNPFHDRRRDPVLRAGFEIQRRLMGRIVQGHGLYGLVEVLAEVLDRPAILWNRHGSVLASSLGDTPPPTHPTDAPVRGAPGSEYFRHGEWIGCAVRSRTRCEVMVGIHDPDDDAPRAAMLAMEHAGMAAAIELFRLRSVARAESRRWGEFAEQVLTDPVLDRVRARADALGYDLDRPHRLAVVSDDGDTERLDEHLRAALGALVSLGDPDVHAMLMPRDDGVAMLVDDDLDWEKLARASDEAGARHVRIGVSASHDALESLRADATREAEAALRLAQAFEDQRVVRFDDLGLFRVLAGDGDPSELLAVVDRWLGPVIEYDRARGADLVHTIEEYLSYGGSVDQAAAALFIHRSTLRYRLGRISDLIGEDLADPEVRFQLQLATRILATVRALRGDDALLRAPPGAPARARADSSE